MDSLSTILAGHGTDDILDAIITNSFTSVMVTEAKPDTPIVHVNNAFTALTGYNFDEVTGKSPRLLQGPKTDSAVIDRLRNDLQAGRVFEGSAVNYRKDGSEFMMFWRVVPVMNQDGDPAFFVALQQEAPMQTA